MTTLKELILQENLEDLEYEEISRILNEKPLIPNPITEAPLIPKPLKMSDFLGAIKSTEKFQEDMAIVASLTELVKVGSALSKHLGVPDTGDIQGFITLLVESGLSDEAKEALERKLQETIPDPNYQPFIPGLSKAEEAGLGLITPERVQGALN
jgi:hypothetical protein